MGYPGGAMEIHPVNCIVCGTELSRHQSYSGGVCDDWRCRTATLEADLVRHRTAAAEASGVPDPDQFAPVVVPFRRARSVPLPRGRQAIFRARLQEKLREARASADDDAVQPGPDGQQDPTLPGSVCAVCRGACCHRGGNHAFLDAGSLRRVLSARPGWTDEIALQEYLSRLPASSLEGSCVYHTDAGCQLPRGLRSTVCNTYLCRGLKDALEHFERGATSRAFVAAREDHRILHSAFVAEGRVIAEQSDVEVP